MLLLEASAVWPPPTPQLSVYTVTLTYNFYGKHSLKQAPIQYIVPLPILQLKTSLLSRTRFQTHKSNSNTYGLFAHGNIFPLAPSDQVSLFIAAHLKLQASWTWSPLTKLCVRETEIKSNKVCLWPTLKATCYRQWRMNSRRNNAKQREQQLLTSKCNEIKDFLVLFCTQSSNDM